MRKNRFTIKTWLQSTAWGIFAIFALLGIIVIVYVNLIGNYYDILQKTNRLAYLEAEIRKLEKNFIYEETINDEYYISRKSNYLTAINSQKSEIKNLIKELKSNRFIKKQNFSEGLNSLDSNFTQYEETFSNMVESLTKIGFKDYGLTGEMRKKIHAVENYITKLDHGSRLSVYMLTLRRHEKDYFLRKDSKYIEKFNTVIEDFNQFIDKETASANLNADDGKYLKDLLNGYQDYFNKIVNLDIQIGLNDNSGLKNKLNITVSDIETAIIHIRNSVSDIADRKINEALILLTSVGAILLVGVIILMLRLSKHISKSIAHVHKYITILGKGQLPSFIVSKRNDEISDMTESLNILIENLQNTRRFAIEVGTGNLDTDINVFDNKGDIGGSLIEMRNQLAQVAEERERTKKEADRRAWVSEGKARNAEILRSPGDDQSKFYFYLLTNIVDYLGANIGAIYIIKDIDNEDLGYELTAAISYNHNDTDIFSETDVKRNTYIFRAIKEQKILTVNNIPKGKLKLSSSVVEFEINSLIVSPLKLRATDKIVGALEIGAMKKFKQYKIDLLLSISNDIAIAVSNIMHHRKTERLYKHTRKQAEQLAERQEEIERQKELLQEQAKTLQESNNLLEIQKEQTAGSIRYAKSIQNAVLPDKKILERAFRNHFLIFKPRDIVSGDFYRIMFSSDNERPLIFLTIADCTGHGVPGAFMSMIGSMLLQQIIDADKITDPKRILSILNERVIKALHQNKAENTTNTNKDGMDIALVRIEPVSDNDYKIVFSGGKIDMYYYRVQEDKTLQKLKADRKSIGGLNTRSDKEFTDSEISLSSGDKIYIFSDGIPDLNNSERKRFSSKSLLNLLNSLKDKKMKTQKAAIDNEIILHQGQEPQRDDMALIACELI
jgi:serine phosphatase RsbU (regulator of sigma subunit)/methyl-accepting chemotaxis protein